jgi:hypothetical protein
VLLISGPSEGSSHGSDTPIGSLGAEARSVVALAVLLVRGWFSRADRAFVQRRVRRHRQFWIDAARVIDLPTRLIGEAGLEISLNHRSPEEQLVIQVSDVGHVLPGTPEFREPDDEESVYDLLAAEGVPVVTRRFFTIATMSAAARFLDGALGSCIVTHVEEPLTGHRATPDVGDARTLRIAAATAAAAAVAREVRGARHGSRSWPGRMIAGLRDLSAVPLVIRPYVRGEVFRLLYLDEELIDAVRRAAPAAAGDELCLPARHLVSPSVVELGTRAAAAVGVRLIGVDVVVDPGPDHAGGFVLAIDRFPRLDLHYHGMPGAVDVARTVLERLAQV